MARFVVTADWDSNAPHLSEQARKDLWDSIPVYQRDARGKGIPQLGAGLIYAISDEDIVCDAFPVPDHWPRGYGLDVGWNRTAAEWICLDPDTQIQYFFDEHYKGEASPEIHAAAIRRRGLWIPGRIDPAARGRNQKDGEELMKLYQQAIYGQPDKPGQMAEEAQGAGLGIANNAVETGIYDMLMAFQGGGLKIMKGRCPNLLAERRLYRRNEKGIIIKKFDHALDAARYAYKSGIVWLRAKPAPLPKDHAARFRSAGSLADDLGWMAN